MDLNHDFLDADDQNPHYFPSSRLERIGPWVETTKDTHEKSTKLKQGLRFNQQNEQNKKKLNFLSNLNKQIQVKRRRFRTMIQRAESVQRQIDQTPLCKNFFQNIGSNNHAQANTLEQQIHKAPMNPKNKKVLNTTMYVYESHPPRRLSKLCRTTRAISFGYTSPINEKKQAMSQREENQSFQGSRNLQRILKMKEKIRVKNNYVVKKIREKKIESDKQVTEKYLSELHSLQRWRSITLDTESGKEKKEGQKFKPAYSNFKITDHSFNLQRTTTSKYFN